MAKKVSTRIQNKRDTTANWATASANGFIPLDGEFIIYADPDSVPKVKIGDGKTLVGDLPFLSHVTQNYVEVVAKNKVTTYAELDEIISENDSTSKIYRIMVSGGSELSHVLESGRLFIGIVTMLSLYLVDTTTKATWTYNAGSETLTRFTIGTSDIADNSVTSEKLADGAVTPEKMTTHDLTVMTFNNKGWTGINSDINLMNSIFDKYKPDIVGFQEYYTGRSIGGIPTDDYVKSICPDLFVGPADHSIVCNALISKYELTEPTSIDYESQAGNYRYYQKSYIYVDGIKIAVFNTHVETTSNYSWKKAQTLEIVAACAKEDNFILIGDFNTSVKSTDDAAYADFVKPFVDAGFNLANCSEKFGYMNTWTSGNTADHSSWCPTDNIITSPNIRIDRAFVDRAKIEADTGKVIDHLPLVTYLTIHIPRGGCMLTDTDKTEIANIVMNEYDSSVMELLGGDDNA